MTRTRWATAAAVAIAALHALAAAGYAFATRVDEAYFLRLGRALRAGAYALPGVFGGPVSDPLPGWPLLLGLVDLFLGDAWGAYRWVGLAAVWAAAALGWLLARRLLPPVPAALAALAAAASPTLAALSGSLMSDAAFAAASAGALLIFALDRRDPRAEPLLSAVCALAALTRPEGVLLVLAIAAARARAESRRAAFVFAGAALAPWALWSARNLLVAGAAGGGYALNFWASAGLSPAAWLWRASEAVSVLAGAGALGLVGAPLPVQWGGGLLALILAARGARRLSARPAAVAAGLFAGGVVLLHAAWGFPAPRHAACLLAPLWILMAAGVEGLDAPRRAGALALGALAVAWGLRADWLLARPERLFPPPALSATAEWARRELPPDARLESVVCQPLALLSGRETLCSFARAPREAWVAGLLERGVRWVHDPGAWSPDGYFPPAMASWARERGRWLAPPYFTEAFRDPVEGRVLILRVGDEKNFLSAVRGYERAGEAARAGDLEAARASLDAALKLEPRLAQGWALRSVLEPDARKARAYLARARAADPGDAEIAAELEARSR